MSIIVHKIIQFIADKDYRFDVLSNLGFYNKWSDKKFLQRKYTAIMKRPLNLDNPQTFNEKLQWLKIYDRRPEYTVMVDKYKVRDYVANKIGDQYLIPLLGVWDDPDEIDFSTLPNQFVLKCNHDSGGLVICKDKSKLDIKRVKDKLRKSLHHDYYKQNREWPYKDVPRRIICEKYMTDESGQELKDYKFFCFGGQVKCFKVDFDRFIEHHANYYDPEGHILNFGEASYPPNPKKQLNLDMVTIHNMEDLARELSASHPFLRTDFYDINGKIYFGELTFYPASGFGKFTDENADALLGKWLKLPGGVPDTLP